MQSATSSQSNRLTDQRFRPAMSEPPWERPDVIQPMLRRSPTIFEQYQLIQFWGPVIIRQRRMPAPGTNPPRARENFRS